MGWEYTLSVTLIMVTTKEGYKVDQVTKVEVENKEEGESLGCFVFVS
jgi:hypothetical protein